MLKIRNYTAVKSFEEFVEKQNLEETVACIDDGECQHKTKGYRVKDFFIYTRGGCLYVYLYNASDDKWVVI